MPKITYIDSSEERPPIPEELTAGRRRLTEAEIRILERNLNVSDDPSWSNFYVDASDGGFDPALIRESSFSGFVALGRLRPARLKYHDLELPAGIYRSRLKDTVTGDDNAISNVSYLDNYRTGRRVVLFNIQEMSCTVHSKFGNGILKKGEPEENRIWIATGNENGGRSVLPFESMIPADAYLWSHYRDDPELLRRFQEFTEAGNQRDVPTFGTVADDAVVKNTILIKDAKIGACAYIKGALKLKNITVLSSADEVSQIGEGVVLVNGIMGYGSRVFYNAVAVRFVIGRNCQLKYGARLLNSVLGDNSTVSCCELISNLLFPFHEQHHNTSFLIAATIMGQANVAAGATVGSNHNSRSPDGEIVAGRGFWPGLCSDFKHNSRFASFTLVAKGSYQYELDIPYPFSLVSPGSDGEIRITPAWYFLHDMYAVVRNKYKFDRRDRRAVRVQRIETDPIAPDTVQEILSAMRRLESLTLEALPRLRAALPKGRGSGADTAGDCGACAAQDCAASGCVTAGTAGSGAADCVTAGAAGSGADTTDGTCAAGSGCAGDCGACAAQDCAASGCVTADTAGSGAAGSGCVTAGAAGSGAAGSGSGESAAECRADSASQLTLRDAGAFLEQEAPADFTLRDGRCQKRRGAVLLKPARAYRMYGRIVKYFAARALVEYCGADGAPALTQDVIGRLSALPLYEKWVNVGGQIIPEKKVAELFSAVKGGAVAGWDAVHEFYGACGDSYSGDKARYALFLMEQLYGVPAAALTDGMFRNLAEEAESFSVDMYLSSVSSRRKDFTDEFRAMTYRSPEEMTAVLGGFSDSGFLRVLRADTESFNARLKAVFGEIAYGGGGM